MRYYMPTEIYHDNDCIKMYGKRMRFIGSKAIIITGRNSSANNGSLKELTDSLESNGIGYCIYNRIEENPSIESVMEATKQGINENVDFCIGLGGGSPMDASKAIALMIANPELDESILYEAKKLNSLPVVAIPTTAGTGSEVTQYAVLTIHKERTKRAIAHHIFPVLALIDSKYLRSLNENVLINTIIDTLAHLLESYLCVKATDYSRIYSRSGLECFQSYKDKLLEIVNESNTINNIDDILSAEDYMNISLASVYGGISIAQTTTSLPHGLSYYLTYELDIPHGKACGISLFGFLKEYESNDSMRVQEVLEYMGFNDTEEFRIYMSRIVGKTNISKEEWLNNAITLLNNKVKISNYPFEIKVEDIIDFL